MQPYQQADPHPKPTPNHRLTFLCEKPFYRAYTYTFKLGVEEWLVSAVMSMYTGAKTVVRTVNGNSKGFEVKVGMHQGSGLSPLLFVIVMEAISREFRVALPWELLYADGNGNGNGKCRFI